MKAVKDNKEYTIEENQKKSYQDAGFDILNDAGEMIAYGKGRSVPYGDYKKLESENKLLKEKLRAAEASAKNTAPAEEVKSEEKREKNSNKKAGD